jgi:hypothetical protein
MNDDFNNKFNDKGEKPTYIYKRNPLVEHSFQIFGYMEEKGDYEPVGDYLLLDTTEDPDLTEKTVMNIVRILNGKQDLMDLTNLTKTRLLFNIVPRKPESDETKVIFRTHDGKGTSEENAVLTLKKGVYDERPEES